MDTKSSKFTGYRNQTRVSNEEAGIKRIIHGIVNFKLSYESKDPIFLVSSFFYLHDPRSCFLSFDLLFLITFLCSWEGCACENTGQKVRTKETKLRRGGGLDFRRGIF